MDARDLLRRADSLSQLRAPWDGLWQEIADWIAPDMGSISVSATPVTSTGSADVVDSTAQQAVSMLVSGLHGGLAPPTSEMFRFVLNGVETTRDVAKWLKTCADIVHTYLEASNFATELNKTLRSYVLFGLGVLYIEGRPEGGLRFAARHVREVYIAEDENGEIDTVFRRFKMSARGVSRFFGRDTPDSIAKKAESEPDELVELLHCVFPRDVAPPPPGSKVSPDKMPFASVYVDIETGSVIREGGYMRLPFMVARGPSSPGDVYGRSPAMDVLPDVKMLNEVAKTALTAAHMTITPPLLVPANLDEEVALVPGALNYYDSLRMNAESVKPMVTVGDIAPTLNMVNDLRQSIMRGFHADLFTMFTGDPNMTATQVIERRAEKLVLLGPLLGSVINELLAPCIRRCFTILNEQGAIPIPPSGDVGGRLDVQYVSPLAQARRASELAAMLQSFNIVNAINNVTGTTSVVDNFDPDKAFVIGADILGVPSDIIRKTSEVNAIRAARQQAAYEQAQAQQAMQVAGLAASAKKGTSVDTALGSLLGSAQQPTE
jgi:hypothetical protein